MELTCTVNPAALEDYVQNDDLGGTGDDVAPVRWGGVWLGPATIDKGFVTATGARTIVAANLSTRPVGQSMVTTTFTVATIRYLVKPLMATATSPFTCTGSFLNRNGNPVITPTFVAPTAPTIIPDYTMSGNVSYQGRTAKNGIGIHCCQSNSTSLSCLTPFRPG